MNFLNLPVTRSISSHRSAPIVLPSASSRSQPSQNNGGRTMKIRKQPNSREFGCSDVLPLRYHSLGFRNQSHLLNFELNDRFQFPSFHSRVALRQFNGTWGYG